MKFVIKIRTATAVCISAVFVCAQVHANDATATPQKKAPPIGFVAGSFENLLNHEFGDTFWNNGKAFADVVKEEAKKKRYWQAKIYAGVPPFAQNMGDKLGPMVDGALNIKQFAKYVLFVNQEGNPAFTEKPVYPRIIVGVVTPVDISNSKDYWSKRLQDAGRVATDITQKYAESHGAAVFEIVRVVAADGQTIYSESVKRDVALKDAFLITVGNRYWVRSKDTDAFDKYKKFFASTYPELAQGLDEIFTKNLHVMTRKEVLEAELKELEVQLEAIKKLQKFLDGLKQEDLYPKR